MKHLTKMIFGAASLMGLAVGSAQADDAAPPAATLAGGTLSAYMAAASDYRFRGISQNAKEVTPEGSINWSGPDGFYIGTWEAKTNWGGNNPSFEADIFGGKHFDLGGTDLNVEAYYYSYPDARTGGGPKASFYETIVQLAHTFGPVSLTVTGANSPEWSLGGGNAWYVEGTASIPVNDWLSISGNVGHQWVHGAVVAGFEDYTHYDIGATATWKSWSLDARYVGSDISSAACRGYWMATSKACQGTVVATLTYNIANLLQ